MLEDLSPERGLERVRVEEPELVPAIVKIFRHETELRSRYPDKPGWWEWEVGDVGIPPWMVVKLARYNVIYRTYKSSRHSYWRLKDYDATKRFLMKLYEKKERPHVERSEVSSNGNVKGRGR